MSETAADTRYTLTQEELGWAIDLRNTLNAKGLPVPKPDLLLAQFAIAFKGKTEKAVKKVKLYQQNIVEMMEYSTEAALQSGCVGIHSRKFPGMLASAKDTNGRTTLVIAGAYSFPSQIKGEDEMKQFMTEQLLWCDASNADLDYIRKGSAFINVMSNLSMANFSLDMQRRTLALCQDSYPGRVGIMPFVDAGPIFSTLLKLCSVFLSKKVSERIVVCSSKGLVTKHGFDPASLPPSLGGTFEKPYEEWIKEKLAQRLVAAERVKIG